MFSIIFNYLYLCHHILFCFLQEFLLLHSNKYITLLFSFYYSAISYILHNTYFYIYIIYFFFSIFHLYIYLTFVIFYYIVMIFFLLYCYIFIFILFFISIFICLILTLLNLCILVQITNNWLIDCNSATNQAVNFQLLLLSEQWCSGF